MSLLECVNSPQDLKKLSVDQLKLYAKEVRAYITDVVNKNGGHLSSNLGAVDFTIALHYVFDCPNDKIVFDVGHQSYTHKLITGRRNKFALLRSEGGVSGYENMKESDCDAFTTGHSSTSLSVAMGLAKARDLQDKKHDVIAVVGDGALTGGLSYEGLNNIGGAGVGIIVVLNDNGMSISENVGSISSCFGNQSDKQNAGVFFENMGFEYFGPIDGNDIEKCITALLKLKGSQKPVVLHLKTKKGLGYEQAENNAEKYHGIEHTEANCGKFSDLVGKTLVSMAEKDRSVVAITAAMALGTGLSDMREKFPERFFDVGIAEQHAVTMSAGLATGGLKPYFAVYSTFLQRAYDQILHDIGITSAPVRLLVDKSGVVASDGATHQGLYDISFLSSAPNMTVLSPANGEELNKMLYWSLSYDKPLAIRYPKNYLLGGKSYKTENPLCWEYAKNSNNNVTILAVGNRMIDLALQLNCECDVVNARCIKPLDEKILTSLNEPDRLIITLEDGVLNGGFGSAVLSFLNRQGKKCEIISLGFSDEVWDELSMTVSLEKSGLTKGNLEKIISSYRANCEKILE
ncbi:MAG: 1-deoxy-D-xylulose-5-phosphate synthase [Clostridia bacterium]|nr:1-deoxy-D-xylulose-5-phosphate synthase [Clostridia bacterium]